MFREPGSGSFSGSEAHCRCQTKVLTVPTHLDSMPEAGHGIARWAGEDEVMEQLAMNGFLRAPYSVVHSLDRRAIA